jgi:hypothetical protein
MHYHSDVFHTNAETTQQVVFLELIVIKLQRSKEKGRKKKRSSAKHNTIA